MIRESASSRGLGTRLIVAVFALFFGVLAFGYFLFLRSDDVPVFAQVRPGEAAAIVAQLESKDIPYRLADGGTTILIPAHQADMARLAIAGSDVALKGGIGFELFNKSDMGLTDFAQRINYQRALQGELERSIMMIAGVDTARVHLAMPERTIFRSERSNAKAAVELVARPGTSFDAMRVAGVQRLVAFAVPDLTPADVVVLDGDGRVLGDAAAGDADMSPDAEERRSVQGYYRARARAAVQQALPGADADVTVTVLGDAAGAAPDTADTSTRNFRLRVIFATPAPLNPEDVAVVRSAVVTALTLDEAAGDELSFRVGTATRGMSPPMIAAAPPRAMPDDSRITTTDGATSWTYYGAAAGIVLLIAVALVVLRRRRATRLTAPEREAMIERVRAALHPTAA